MARKLVICSLLLCLLVAVLATEDNKKSAADEELVTELREALEDVDKRYPSRWRGSYGRWGGGRDSSDDDDDDKRELNDVATVLTRILADRRRNAGVDSKTDDHTPGDQTDTDDNDGANARTTNKRTESELTGLLKRVLTDDSPNDRTDGDQTDDDTAVDALVRDFEEELDTLEREERGKKYKGKKVSIFQKLKGKKKSKGGYYNTMYRRCKAKGKSCNIKRDDCCPPYVCKKKLLIFAKCTSTWG